VTDLPYTTVDQWIEANRGHRAAARLIADTLRAQFPGAAYLVLSIDPESRISSDLFPESVRDARGKILTDFDDHRLLPVPADSAVSAAWCGTQPCNAFHLRSILRALRVSGGTFDDFPEDLRAPHEGDSFLPCMLLSEQARPERWDSEDASEACDLRLRPYSRGPRPGLPNRAAEPGYPAGA